MFSLTLAVVEIYSCFTDRCSFARDSLAPQTHVCHVCHEIRIKMATVYSMSELLDSISSEIPSSNRSGMWFLCSLFSWRKIIVFIFLFIYF